MLKYLVLYTSSTGNTKQLATEIFASLPGTSKDIINIRKDPLLKEAEIYLVGFWINRGTCPLEVIDALSQLHGRKVLLFGTCGMGGSDAYFRTIESHVNVFIPDDNEYLGCYLCQGKMPIQVRHKYERILETDGPNKQVEDMIRNFDEALLHPDANDFSQAKSFLCERLSLES